MKLYVASSWRNNEQPAVVNALRENGHEVYDFRNPHLGPGARGVGFHWSDIDPDWQSWTPAEFREALKHPLAVDGFAADQEGMDWSEGTVLVLPSGRSSHLELGYAVGQRKPTFILLSNGEPELMYGLATHLCISVEELLHKVAATVDAEKDAKKPWIYHSEQDSEENK